MHTLRIRRCYKKAHVNIIIILISVDLEACEYVIALLKSGNIFSPQYISHYFLFPKRIIYLIQENALEEGA